MNSETEQRLATLEVILEQELLFRPPYHDGDFLKPYIWNSEQQGIFSPLSLIKAEEIERKYNLLSSFLHGNFPELLVYQEERKTLPLQSRDISELILPNQSQLKLAARYLL